MSYLLYRRGIDMKRFLLLLFCILNLTLAARPEQVLRGTVLWIIDGDTILLRRGDKLTSIRLWGIDAPEKKQSGGEDATRHLIKLIGRKRVKIITAGIGRYGRIIGKIYCNGKFVNLEMVKAGHAWWHQKYCPAETVFKEAEAKARENRLGLWKEANPIRPGHFRHPESVAP